MQKCQECTKEFEWKKIVGSLLWGYKPIKCDRCNSIHDVSFKARIGIVFFGIIIPIILGFTGLMIELNPWIVLTVLLVFIAAVMAIAPFHAGYIIRKEDAV